MRLSAWILGIGLVTSAGVASAKGADAAAVGKRTGAPAASLGHIEFPTSGPPAAQAHFLRGVLALHSFWYPEAKREFEEALKLAPDFAMARWGLMQSYFHAVWREENVAKEGEALAAIDSLAKLTPREAGYLAAARLLVGDGTRDQRWRRYADAMRALHEAYPKDDEAATFFSAALLGVFDEMGPGFHDQAEAAASSLGVWAHNPSHPGAVHYIIHAFDDPDHAILALPQARRYGDIAPEAAHARHMPAHIYVQLGMWEDAIAANLSSWEAATTWVEREKLDATLLDYHTLSWLPGLYLETGRRVPARKWVAQMATEMAATHDENERPWLRQRYVSMVIDYLSESDDWGRLVELLAPLATAGGAPPPLVSPAATPSTPSTVHSKCRGGLDDEMRAADSERAKLAWVNGLAALARRDVAAANRAADALAQSTHVPKDVKVAALDLRGRAALAGGQTARGLDLLAQAAAQEDKTPDNGPVLGVLQRERLGEAQLATGHAADALASFRHALQHHPRRGRSLYGAARAADAAHEPAAAAAYWAELAKVWDHADDDWPGLADVRRAAAARVER